MLLNKICYIIISFIIYYFVENINENVNYFYINL